MKPVVSHYYMYCEGKLVEFANTKEGLAELAKAMDAADAAHRTYWLSERYVDRRRTPIDPMPTGIKLALIGVIIAVLGYLAFVIYTIA